MPETIKPMRFIVRNTSWGKHFFGKILLFDVSHPQHPQCLDDDGKKSGWSYSWSYNWLKNPNEEWEPKDI